MYTPPAYNEVDFDLVVYTVPDYDASDFPLIVVPTEKFGDDSGTGSDLSISQLVAGLLDDAASGSDTSSLLSLVVLTDTGSGVDDSGLSITLTLTDTGSGVDVSSLVVLNTLVDAASGSDNTVSQLAFLGLTDNGSGSDTSQTGVILLSSDMASGNDISISSIIIVANDLSTEILELSSLISVVSASDSGSGEDVANLLATLIASTESGVGVDVSALASIFTSSDLATGDDALSLLAEGLLTDTASGVELVNSFSASLSDTGSSSELLLARVFEIAEVSSGNDFVASYYKIIDDAGSGVDIISLGVLLSSLDASTPAEQPGVFVLYPYVVPSYNEANFDIYKLPKELAVLLAESDTQDEGSGEEYFVHVVDLLKSDSTLLVSEDNILGVSVAGIDTGLGNDLANIVADILASDGAIGEDTQTLGVFILTNDMSVETFELLSLLAESNAIDSGIGADTLIELVVVVSSTDVGVGGEFLTSRDIEIIDESGSGLDAAELSVYAVVHDGGDGTSLLLAKYMYITDDGIGEDEVIHIMNRTRDIILGLYSRNETLELPLRIQTLRLYNRENTFSVR